jgi:hypothetical protein
MSDERNFGHDVMSETSTFTNAPPSPAINLEELITHAEGAQQRLLATFEGVRVVVDLNLKGNDYYCAVSQEIYDALKAITGA